MNLTIRARRLHNGICEAICRNKHSTPCPTFRIRTVLFRVSRILPGVLVFALTPKKLTEPTGLLSAIRSAIFICPGESLTLVQPHGLLIALRLDRKEMGVMTILLNQFFV